MEREQFKVLVKAMKAVYAQPTFIPDQDAFNVWFALLGDLPYKQAELAVQKHMATEKFPPTIADIREKAEQITSVKETERAIRGSKRILAGYDSAIIYATDEETERYFRQEFQTESVKLKQRERKLKDFCNETGRSVDQVRTQVYAVKDQKGNVVNYGHSTSMKAVWANRKAKK